jgi:CTP synthase (UTP-ammonia lyase)
MDIADADSTEHNNPSSNHIIVAVSCAVPWSRAGDPKLVGANNVTLVAGTRLAAAYGSEAASEQFFCNYEVNADFQSRMEAAGLRINAFGPNGEIRGIELDAQPFFLATLFQPQLTSEASGEAHPLIDAFLTAAESSRDSATSAKAANDLGASRP